MKNKKEKIITDEGLVLKPYPRETKVVSLELSVEVIDFLRKKAEERDMPLKALLRFYVGQGLRQDLTKAEAKELVLKKLKSRKSSKANFEIDLAA